MGAMKRHLLEQAEREIAEQLCKKCDGNIGMDWEEGGCVCESPAIGDNLSICDRVGG